ncbi:MAG: MarR family winged helix-turn-helix transcriptional regulator [Candidatus Dormibacteria bacterium]
MSNTGRREDLEQALAREWRHLGSELLLLSQAIADRLGVNTTDLQCLSILTSAGAMTAGELADRTALTTGAVTGVIDRLEQATLVRREKDRQDRRRVIVQALSDEEFSRRAPEFGAVFEALARGGAHPQASYTDTQLEFVIDYLKRSHPVIHNQIAATRQSAGSSGDASAPLGHATAGKILFSRGVSHVSIDGSAGGADLYSAHFEGTVPEIRVDDGTITVQYRRFGLFEGRPRASRFSLNPTIPWELEIRGGVHRWTGDLQQLRLHSLEVRGGISEMELDLAAPTGVVPLRLTGGISKMTVRRPAGSALSLQVRGGASKLVLDDQEFGAFAGNVRLESRDQGEGDDRYELEITGGVSRLSIGTR